MTSKHQIEKKRHVDGVSSLIRYAMQAGVMPQAEGHSGIKFSASILDEHVEIIIEEAGKQGILPATLKTDGRGGVVQLCDGEKTMEAASRYLLRCSVAKRIERMTGRKAKIAKGIDATIHADADAWHECPRPIVSLVRQQFTSPAQQWASDDIMLLVSLCERASKAAEDVGDDAILALLRNKDTEARRMLLGMADGTEIDALRHLVEGLEALATSPKP